VQRAAEEKVLHLKRKEGCICGHDPGKKRNYIWSSLQVSENSNASKPSQFLEDNDHTQNPLVEVIDATQLYSGSGLTSCFSSAA
jgi:hypothetical protein